MMDYLTWVVFSRGLHSSQQRLVVWIVTCVALFTCCQKADGQLRTGRQSRVIYAKVAGAQPTNSTAVVSASYLDETASIIDSAEVVPVSCDGCSGGCDSCDDMYPTDVGCGGLDCGPSGCNTCAGGYSSIAPTCTAYCPPGCGPLLALWYRMSVRAEVPLYWRRGQGLPSLVTTADAGTGADLAGQLGETTTSVLLGDTVPEEQAQAGFRITLGTWIGGTRRYGLIFRYWNAGDEDESFRFDSSGFPILARPFLNTTVVGSPEQDTVLVAFPGENVGDIQVDTTSSVSGLEFSLRRLLYMDRFTRVDWLSGYQHIAIDEGLTIRSNSTVTGNLQGLQGTMIAISDRFQTENEFNGASYGLMSSRHFACWKLESMFRLGAGNLRRRVNVVGSTTTTSGGTANTEAQGLLARNTNRQAFEDDTFVIVPEVGVNLACTFRPGVDFNVGYNFLLVPKVAQAAQQIDNDLSVNLSDPLVGALDPQLDFTARRYWLHSLGLGMQIRY